MIIFSPGMGNFQEKDEVKVLQNSKIGHTEFLILP
jgi:hypothetical protein